MGKSNYRAINKALKGQEERKAMHDTHHPKVLIPWTCTICYPIPKLNKPDGLPYNSSRIHGGLKRYSKPKDQE